MTRRPLRIRQAMIAGVSVSIFMTVLNTVQSPPESRVASFLLTAGFSAVCVGAVLLVARAVQHGRPDGPAGAVDERPALPGR